MFRHFQNLVAYLCEACRFYGFMRSSQNTILNFTILAEGCKLSISRAQNLYDIGV